MDLTLGIVPALARKRGQRGAIPCAIEALARGEAICLDLGQMNNDRRRSLANRFHAAAKRRGIRLTIYLDNAGYMIVTLRDTPA